MSRFPRERDHTRHATRVICSYSHRDKRFLTLTLDLGLGGTKIETCRCLPKGEEVDIQLILQDNCVQLKGRTIYSHLLPGKRIRSGIQFLEVSEESRTLLEEYLTDLEKWPKPKDMVSVKHIGEDLIENNGT